MDWKEFLLGNSLAKDPLKSVFYTSLIAIFSFAIIAGVFIFFEWFSYTPNKRIGEVLPLILGTLILWQIGLGMRMGIILGEDKKKPDYLAIILFLTASFAIAGGFIHERIRSKKWTIHHHADKLLMVGVLLASFILELAKSAIIAFVLLFLAALPFI